MQLHTQFVTSFQLVEMYVSQSMFLKVSFFWKP